MWWEQVRGDRGGRGGGVKRGDGVERGWNRGVACCVSERIVC